MKDTFPANPNVMKPAPNATRDEILVNRVRLALEHVPDVHEKKMFGSLAFMVRGRMCVTARPERLMCRIAPERHEAAVERKGCQTVVMKGRNYKGYVYIDADAVRTERALKYWIKLALDHNQAQEKIKRP